MASIEAASSATDHRVPPPLAPEAVRKRNLLRVAGSKLTMRPPLCGLERLEASRWPRFAALDELRCLREQGDEWPGEREAA